MSEAPTRLPDLYQLLALGPLEADRAKIEAAIKRLLARAAARAAAGDDPAAATAEAQRIHKVVALAQKYLLDPKHKAAYDAQWRSVHHSRPATAAAQAWDTSRLDQLLPQGDPQAPFDMTTYLDARDHGDPPIEHLPRDVPSRQGLSERLKKKRRRALLVGSSLFVAGVAAMVLLGVFLLGGSLLRTPGRSLAGQSARLSTSEVPQGNRLPEENRNATPQPTLADESDHRPIVGSGLPRPGQGNAVLDVDLSSAKTPASKSPDAQSPGAQSRDVQSRDVQAPDAQPAEARASQAISTAPATTAAMSRGLMAPTAVSPDATLTEPTAGPPAASPPMADAKLTREDKLAWRGAMNEAKTLIGGHDFSQAEKKFAELKEMAKTAVQREQLQRLEEISGFVKDIHQAMVEAIGGLSAAETFKIGTSTIAAFVEGDESRITVRVSGMTRAYRLEEMPVPLGLALVDLKLDNAQAATLARKGAYILMHPNNRTTLKHGQQMLDEAAAAGAISPELARFYEDDTSLAGLAQ